MALYAVPPGTFMNRVCRAATALLFAAPAAAQPPAPDPAALRGDSAQTQKRLSEAEAKLKAGDAADAADALQKILDEAGDDFVPADKEGKEYRPARWFAHRLLARLPADARKGYQDRVDEPAAKLILAGRRDRDPAPLWQLLDRYFVSRPAADGLLLLGDLLFERGEFRAAEGVWRRLLTDAGADVAHPDPKADPAAVRARLILAAIFAGESGRAKADLAAFRTKHPGAKGTFAGKDGPFADTLDAHLKTAPVVPPAANPGTDWPAFGGGPDRSGRTSPGVPYWDFPAVPTWTAALPKTFRPDRAPAGPPARPPFGHPVVAGGKVFVTDGAAVYGFDLLHGRKLDLPAQLATPSVPPFDREKPPPDGCPALAAAGDRVYARVGPAAVVGPAAARAPDPNKPGDQTAIVCLGPAPGGVTYRELWRVRPPGAGKVPVAWEGAPLVAGRRMWAAFARFEGGRVVHGVECFDPADGNTAPAPAWTAEVCDSPLPQAADPRTRQELVTLAGRHVVFLSNTGAVIALDAATGRRAWAFRYPRSRKADPARSPDPAPAVASGGRVFVAPADADRVYALDAETGRLLWESGPVEGAQVVGVAAGRLVVNVTGPVLGVRAFDVATGTPRWEATGAAGYGRGFVTDGVVAWPGRTGLLYVHPEDGRVLGTSHAQRFGAPRPFGNLAYADGVLVAVTPTEVWGFVPFDRRFPVTTGRGRFRDLTGRAEAALAAGDPAAAREKLLAVARGDFAPPLRAWAAARLLLLSAKADDERQLPADLRAVLTPDVRGEWLLPPDGVPATLDTLVLRHVGREPAPVAESSPAACERKPDDAPTLSGDADVARTLRLPPGSVPLHWLPGAGPPTRVVVATPDGLLAVPLATGDPTRHAAAGGFTHAADLPGGFVAAGPSAVAVYGAGRAAAWVFRVPTTDPLPERPGAFRVFPDDAPPPAELSSFHLAGSVLVARLGDRHLIALDLGAKRIAWVLGTHGTPAFRPHGFPGDPRVGPTFAVAGRLVVAQRSDGRRWCVRLDTGRVLDVPGFDQPTARAWWPLPPAEVGPDRLAVSDGPGLVRLLDLATGRVRWTRQEDGEASLSGEPPQVRAWGDAVLVAVRRNHGVDLDRLDPRDGKSAWGCGPAFLDADRLDLSRADADADRVYVPAGKTLSAFARKDGKPAWEAELPDARGSGGWVVRAGAKCVIAYPESAVPREPVADVFARLGRSFRADPRPGRLPALAATAYDAWVTRSVPVLLFDPETGNRLGEVEVPAAGPAVAAWFAGDVAVVATGDRVAWLR
jgi:outer membrane protein assembly factor BamB